MINEEDINRAVVAGGELFQMVTSVRYRPKSDRIEIITSWCSLVVDRQRIPELRNISKKRMAEICVSKTGIHVESADMDIEAAGLVVFIARQLITEAEKSVGVTFS